MQSNRFVSRTLHDFARVATRTAEQDLPPEEVVGHALDLGVERATERGTRVGEATGILQTLGPSIGELDLALTPPPLKVRATLREGRPRVLAVQWSGSDKVTPLGDGVRLFGSPEHYATLESTGAESAIALHVSGGGLYVIEVSGLRVRELWLAPVVVAPAAPERILPPTPWEAWRAQVMDGTLLEELDELARRGGDADTLAAAGALAVHARDPSLSSAEEVSLLLRGERVPVPSRGWLDGLEPSMVERVEDHCVALAHRFEEDLLLDAELAAWKRRAEVPLALRVERDRWELVREALRERGAGAHLEAALHALDTAMSRLLVDDASAVDTVVDRLILAGALREDGWWVAMDSDADTGGGLGAPS